MKQTRKDKLKMDLHNFAFDYYYDYFLGGNLKRSEIRKMVSDKYFEIKEKDILSMIEFDDILEKSFYSTRRFMEAEKMRLGI